MKLHNIIFLLVIALLASCATPQQRQERRANRKLAKLLKKNPELAKTDTTWKDTLINAPAIKDSAKASFKSDSGAIDAIIDKAKLPISDSAKKALKDSVNSFLENRERDTIVKSKSGIKYRIKEKGNAIDIEVEKDPQPIKFKYPQIIRKIAPTPELSWLDKIKLQIGEYLMYLFSFLLLLLIIYIAYRLVKKRFFL